MAVVTVRQARRAANRVARAVHLTVQAVGALLYLAGMTIVAAVGLFIVGSLAYVLVKSAL